MWKRRKLSLTGKVLILKALGISQLIFLANLVSFSKEKIKEINKIMYEFIWNSPIQKMKQNMAIQDYEHGGIRMPDLESIVLHQKFKWIQL